MKDSSFDSANSLITAEEVMLHPEWNPCELIRGKVAFRKYMGGVQGSVAANLLGDIGVFVRDREFGTMFAAGTGFYLERNPDTVLAPDVMFVAKRRTPEHGWPDDFLSVAPDLTVEVLSPSDSYQSIYEKVELYLKAGVCLVWVVDPETRSARVYRLGCAIQKINESQSLSGGDVLPGFELKLSDIFSV